MILQSSHLQRPAKVVTGFAVIVFIWLWLSSVQNGRLTGHLLPTVQRGPDMSGKAQTSTISSTNGDAKVAKVSVATNKLDAPVIHRAFLSHQRHNQRHGYTHYIAANEAVSGLIEHDRQHRPKGAWTKPAYILSLLVAELQKPEEERLKWLFWFDADTLIMNPYTPLEIFFPPEDAAGVENVDLLITKNWDGLNSGVFALRVSPWSASFMSAVLAYPIYETARQKKDRFRDQSAFQFLLTDKESPLAETPMKGHDHWVEVPMRWFNSLPVNNAFYKNGSWVFGKNMTEGLFDDGTEDVYDDGHGGKVQPWKVMRGDMVVHFAGSSYVRDSWMEPWVERAEAELPEWANATTQKTLKEEVQAFWNETNEKMVVDRAKSDIEEKAKKKEQERLEKERKEKEEKEKKEKAENERKAKEEKSMADKEKKLEKEKQREQKAKERLEKAAKEEEAAKAQQEAEAQAAVSSDPAIDPHKDDKIESPATEKQ
ncbi:galactosyl transferase gma12 mnn10 family protein [Apodospora peruviana]|uniref:Galactosyl transferase gma12 mnn10 family protein n=1 Tax=Apodospora peruviana TaxID=516989 RepID=A0AAE0IUB8_9PEZI|nr:galactosyl transferase gma12 mnn10 family protein [Apodospora peruviana]